MHRRAPLLIVVSLVASFIAGGVVTRAACGMNNCDYVPLVQSSGADAVNDTCTAPAVVPDGFYAWLTNTTVTPGEAASVCVYVGAPGVQYSVHTVVHQRTGDIQSPEVLTPTGPVVKLPIATSQLDASELIAIEVFYGPAGANKHLDIVYLLTRAAP